MEKAMELAKLACGKEDISEEELKKAAERILQSAEKKTAVEAAKEVCEIARGIVNDRKEEMIGGGIMAEPVQEVVKDEEKEEDLIVRFSAPYRFEGKTYAGIDLSGLKDLRAKDIWKVNRNYRNAGNVSALPEIDAEYTARVAALASRMPIEFFENLPLPEATKIKAKVSGFFMEKE